MKRIERLDLISKIGRELQSRMTFGDIDVYLDGFGVPAADGQRSYNSKWVYAKERLSAVADELIVQIADELGLPHSYVVVPRGEVGDSRYWEAGHFRLFLSHLSSFKGKTAALQKALRPYGVSSFVAHLDIEPTKEWQREIERALFSMNALVAILMPGFKESNWTDQEVGVAVGRGVPIIPVMRGLNPYGFIAKYQGFEVGSRTTGEVARAIFNILLANDQTTNKMWTAFVDTMLLASSVEAAEIKLAILESISHRPQPHLERLREGAAESQILTNEPLKSRLNALLRSEGLTSIPDKSAASAPWDDDDLPF